MTILLSQAVRVGGSVLAAGTTQTLAADLEADLVARKMATYTVAPMKSTVSLFGENDPLTGKVEILDPTTGLPMSLGGSSSITGDRAAFWGDSIASLGFTASTTDSPIVGDMTNQQASAYNPRAWANWANALLGLPFNFVYNGGVSGEHSGQILARSAAVLATNPKWCFFISGRNDVTLYTTVYGGDVAATEAAVMFNNQAAWDLLLGAGCNVITGPITTMTSAGSENATTLGMIQRLNRKLRAAALSRDGVIWVDVQSVLTDTSHVNGYTLASRFFDSTHPGAEGAYLAGKAVATQLAPFVRPYKGLVSSQYDCYQKDALSKNILSAQDGLFTSATSAAAGTGMSGTQLTAATINRSSGAAATAVASVVPAPVLSGLIAEPVSVGNAQQLVITSTAANDQFKVSIPSSVNFAQFPAGSSVYGECAIDVSAATNLVSVSCEVSLTYTGGTPASPSVSRTLHQVATGKTGVGSDSYSAYLRTPPVVLPANATGLTQVAINWYVTFSGAGGATVKIFRASLVKI